jgi:hypothetical protein
LADTDALRGYRRGDAPSLPESDKQYLSDQLDAIAKALAQFVVVMKKLEARMVAHGI